jgi:rubrerythrin
LKGGIRAWQGLKAEGPAEEGMSLVAGAESPSEMIVIAYGMEVGLQGFYTEMGARVERQEASRLFQKLSDIEVVHQKRLFDRYQSISGSKTTKEDFEERVVSHVMEGGHTSEEFLEMNRPSLQTIPDILNVAMMLETQALDLYLRYAFRSEDQETKEVLYHIGNEEKAHLASLGGLMERYSS